MDYYRIAAEGRIDKLREIAESIVNQFHCRIISHPSPGMIMIKHLDPIDKTPFYLGEAFATQCEVEINGCLGYGCVFGDEPERAVYGAILDASLGNGIKIPGEAEQLLLEESSHICSVWSSECKRISRTKVNFDVKKG